MITRSAEAQWNGDVMKGTGTVKLGSGAFEGQYSFNTRFADGVGTNPEELMGAAHAGCFSMALSGVLTRAGTPPTSIHTTAKVSLDKTETGFVISKILLVTQGTVPGIDAATFADAAANAKANCPVSKALAGVEIHLEATLL
ncbi:MAG: OsmC family peroxiredoxin [Bryobacteraceae bacterium]|nr:OsmC family peroxiredoxin [Bryobacteraceae bacterium]